jgi:hypothetical protein
MSGIHILLSDHHGVYVPQVFANGFSMRRWHVSGKDARLLRKGPSDEWYWETWDDVTANAWMMASIYGGSTKTAICSPTARN